MKRECEFNKKHDTNKLMELLSQNIHPVVLGQIYRTKTQIKMLSKRLLADQIKNDDKINNIVNFLCSGSGSHDYTIHRREARDELELNIEKPDEELYRIIKDIYDDIKSELELTTAFDPNQILASNQTKAYSAKRALIESISGGSCYFISEGILSRQVIQIQPGVVQPIINDQRTFDGWKQ